MCLTFDVLQVKIRHLNLEIIAALRIAILRKNINSAWRDNRTNSTIYDFVLSHHTNACNFYFFSFQIKVSVSKCLKKSFTFS
jgi:hypothetical protein